LERRVQHDAEAVDRGALSGELLQFAQVVGNHEVAHAAHIRKVLGAKAPRPTSFDFGDVTSDPAGFTRAAIDLEDLGVGAYNGLATTMTTDTLADAARIVSVEARHAAWIRDLAGKVPAPHAQDIPLSARQATAALRRLEDLQAVFYTEVERNRVLHGEIDEQARVVGSHERAHVVALREVLGRHAVKTAHYDFGGATEDAAAFRRTAVAFEDLSVAAYKAQAPRIVEREYLASALAIHTVEARHAAWIRRLAGQPPVSGPFDEPVSRATATRIVDRTHFVMTMTSSKGPRFTG
jgi:rubrerythrin